jgi:hypothetical protein
MFLGEGRHHGLHFGKPLFRDRAHPFGHFRREDNDILIRDDFLDGRCYRNSGGSFAAFHRRRRRSPWSEGAVLIRTPGTRKQDGNGDGNDATIHGILFELGHDFVVIVHILQERQEKIKGFRQIPFERSFWKLEGRCLRIALPECSMWTFVSP